MTVITLFFNLLRAGLLGKPADRRLFLHLKEKHWEEIFRLSQEQAVVGNVWDGILSLPNEIHPPKTLWFQWLGLVLKIEERNKRLNGLIPEILEVASEACILEENHQFPIALLKGQGTALLYPQPLHRNPGDVDIYSGNHYKALEKNLPKAGFVRIAHSTKHSEYTYKSEVVENHRYVSLFFCPWLAWRLRKLVQEWFPHKLTLRDLDDKKVAVPPPWFEALFAVIHFRTHLHLEGIGWRQLCDWWVIKQQLLSDSLESTEQLSRYRRGLHCLDLVRMERVMEEVFEKLVICNSHIDSLSKWASLVHYEMIKGGSFGIYALNAHTHSFASRQGFWCTFRNLLLHDVGRSIRFYPLFPAEAFFSPFFRLGGYLRRKGK